MGSSGALNLCPTLWEFRVLGLGFIGFRVRELGFRNFRLEALRLPMGYATYLQRIAGEFSWAY